MTVETPELQERRRVRKACKMVNASAADRRWCDPNAVLNVTWRTDSCIEYWYEV